MIRGRFVDARNAYIKARELSAKVPARARSAQRAQREAERMIELEGRLPTILKGDERPGAEAERLDLARLCHYRGLYAASARFYSDAFAARPSLADDFHSGHRYNAACSAALAGSGVAQDSPPPDEAARARLRGQALDWLRADLVAWSNHAGRGHPREA